MLLLTLTQGLNGNFDTVTVKLDNYYQNINGDQKNFFKACLPIREELSNKKKYRTKQLNLYELGLSCWNRMFS